MGCHQIFVQVNANCYQAVKDQTVQIEECML